MVRRLMIAVVACLAVAHSLMAVEPATPLIDNPFVSVFDSTAPLPPLDRDFISITPGDKKVHAGHKGESSGQAGVRTITILVKQSPGVTANRSGYPLAFPRPHAEKLFENADLIVWGYQWVVGEPSPMHFHDKDAVVMFLEDGALASVTPDGKSVLNSFKAGEIRYNKRDRIHYELLEQGSESAIITELK